MSQRRTKEIRRSAIKYAVREEKRIAAHQMKQLYDLPFRYRLIAALGILFRWGRKTA